MARVSSDVKAARLARVQAAYGIVQRRLERAVVDRTQELARRTRLIRLLGRIAEAAAAAETVGDMLRVGVDEISAFLRWPVGHAYHLPEGWPGRLVSTDTWKIRAPDTKAIASFRRASRDVPKRGKSIVGRALAARHALWVEDLADRNIAFIRRPAAARAGFKSGILLPVLAAGAPVAVLEFYTTAKTPVDAAVLSALNQIANHIGQVAERVAARAAQHRSEAVLAAVFANAVDPILVIDEKGIVQSANPAVERVFGFAPLDVIGRNVSMLMPPDVAQRHDGYLRRYFRTGKAKIIGKGREITARRKSGGTFPADLAVGEIDVGGRRLFAGTIRDLSERRSAEASLRTAQQRLVDAVESIDDGIALFDRDEKLVMMNETYRRVWRLPDDIVQQGPRFEDLVRAKVAAGHYSAGRGEDVVRKRVQQFRNLEIAEVNVGPVDHRRDVVTRHFRTRDGGTLLVRSDVTEQRLAEKKMQAAQQRLADAIDYGGNSISLYDADERLVIFNAEFRRVIEPFFGPDLKPGVRFEELARRLAAGGFYGGVRGEDWAQERCRAFRALEPMNLDRVAPDGTKKSGFVNYYRTRDGGTLAVNNDVTALREAEEKTQAVQRRFGEAIDGLADGLALYGPDERLVMCNRAYRDDLAFIGDIVKPGVSFEDILRALSDTQIYDGSGEDWIKGRLAAFRALKDTDVHFNSPQGRKWIRIRRFRASDGGTLLVRSDITAYRMAEEQAQAAQQQLADAIEGIEDGIALFDRDEKLVMMNASYRRAVRTGESDPVAGETFEDLTRRLAAASHYLKGTGEDVVRQRLAQFRAFETVSISAQEPDGPHHLVVRHYRTRDGGTLIVRGDVTEQHRAEEQAMTAQQRLADAIEGISDGLALFDRDERLVLFNRPYVADMAMVAEILKPGLGYETLIRALTRSGYYGAVDGEAHVRMRLERFRNLEEVEILTVLPDGTKKWRQFRHYRTRDGGTLLVRIDITERKRIEAELDSARRNLQVALDSSTDGMALFDASERLVLCNESYRRAVPSSGDIFKPGLSFEDQIRRLMAVGRYPGKDENWLQERLRRFRALEDTSFPALSPEGERQVSIRHYRTRDGGTFMVRSDVTERHEAEKRIAALQHRLTEAIDSVADGMMLFDDQERMVLANEAYRKIFAPVSATLEAGITFEDQIRILMAAGRYPGRGEDWLQWRVEQFRTLATTAHSVETPEGTKHITVRHFRTRDGGTFMVRSDVTAQREAEAQALIQGQRLADAVESVGDAIGLFDADERLVLFNGAYAQFLGENADLLRPGVSLESMVRNLATRRFYKDYPGEWAQNRIQAFRDLKTVEYRIQRSDGERWMVARHFRIRDGGIFLVITDITERMRAMQALERARSEAESANAAKTRFLSSMSHELRTPLNAILGFGQLLDMGQNRMPEEKRQEYTGIILKSGQHLLDLISQVLELSKIENRDIEIKPQTLTPAKMMRECVDMVWEEAKRRAVEIIDATGEGGPGVQFRGDPLRVRQVLINLLSNAVKYNRQGGRVTVRCAEQDGVVRFEVVDTGAGIPISRWDEVFRPFHRLGREAGTIEGSGIGLTIARELVQRMGGGIGFDSLPGEGSTFWFELPAAKPEERV